MTDFAVPLGLLYFVVVPMTLAITLAIHVFQDDMNGDLPPVPLCLFVLFVIMHALAYQIPTVPVLLCVMELVFVVVCCIKRKKIKPME